MAAVRYSAFISYNHRDRDWAVWLHRALERYRIPKRLIGRPSPWGALAERLPGAHCYGFLAGNDAWDAMQEDEPATFYLTDFLARHFESLVVRGLKLDVHPELVQMMFANYKRLIYLAQTDDPGLRERAEAAAVFLGLEFSERRTGYGELIPSLQRFVRMDAHV